MSEASWHRFGASGWLETRPQLSFQDPLDVLESLPKTLSFLSQRLADSFPWAFGTLRERGVKSGRSTEVDRF
jgi:hypothetical protein